VRCVIGMTPGCFARRTEGRKISGSLALRLTEHWVGLPDGQKTLPVQLWNLASQRLRNHVVITTISLMTTYCEERQRISHRSIGEQEARSLTRIALTKAGLSGPLFCSSRLRRAAVVTDEEIAS
jgi:hypothetical protein